MSKILHVGDASGIPCILKKYQSVPSLRKKSRGGGGDGVHEVDLIAYPWGEPYGTNKYYGVHYFKYLGVKPRRWGIGGIWWTRRFEMLTFARNFYELVAKHAKRFDVIHVHSAMKMVPCIRKKNPDVRIILHYHGDELRGGDPEMLKEYEENADIVLVSTPDLLRYGGDYVWLPNPVDTDLFRKRQVNRNNRILCMNIRSTNHPDRMKELIREKYDMPLIMHHPTKDPIQYCDMPDFLAANEYYADLKIIDGRNPNPAYSVIGLQALALGVKVINYNLEIDTELPIIHTPENVVSKLDELYAR